MKHTPLHKNEQNEREISQWRLLFNIKTKCVVNLPTIFFYQTLSIPKQPFITKTNKSGLSFRRSRTLDSSNLDHGKRISIILPLYEREEQVSKSKY